MNEEPYGRGWFLSVSVDNMDEIDALLSPDEYLKHVEERAAK